MKPRKYRLFLSMRLFGYRWLVCPVTDDFELVSVGPSGVSPDQCRAQVEAMLEAFNHPACVEIDPSQVEWPDR